jgi:hypothetical protein
MTEPVMICGPRAVEASITLPIPLNIKQREEVLSALLVLSMRVCWFFSIHIEPQQKPNILMCQQTFLTHSRNKGQFIYSSLILPIVMGIGPFVSPSACIYLSIYLSSYLSIYLSISIPIYLSMYLSTYLSI